VVLVDNVMTVIETEERGWCTQCEAVCPTGATNRPYDIVLEEG
jgi:epoxyqueuosine reductase QueG